MSNLKNKLTKIATDYDELENDEEFMEMAKQVYDAAKENELSLNSIISTFEDFEKSVEVINPTASGYMRNYVTGNLKRALEQYQSVLTRLEREI